MREKSLAAAQIVTKQIDKLTLTNVNGRTKLVLVPSKTCHWALTNHQTGTLPLHQTIPHLSPLVADDDIFVVS